MLITTSTLPPDHEPEAVPAAQHHHRRGRTHLLPEPGHPLHRLHRGHHLLPHEVQRLPARLSGLQSALRQSCENALFMHCAALYALDFRISIQEAYFNFKLFALTNSPSLPSSTNCETWPRLTENKILDRNDAINERTYVPLAASFKIQIKPTLNRLNILFITKTPE